MEAKSIHDIKQQCHELIFKTVEACDCISLNVIREPNQTLQPSCKVIVVVEDIEHAQALADTLKGILRKSNKQIVSALNTPMKDCYSIKYKIKTVSASGDVILTERDAERRIKSTGVGLCSTLEGIISRIEDATTKQQIQAFVNTVDKNRKYTFALRTGTSYRATYFDIENGCRKQCNVGNVLIVVGTATVVKSPELRKQRADKKTSIFTAECKGIGQIAVYNYD